MGIRMNPPEFPKQRRQDPKRRSEAEVFDALQQMEVNGHGLYELRYRRKGRQVDYALWLHDLARFAVQVKGGRYEMDNTGQWTLRTPYGPPKELDSPLEETEEGCMEMRNGILKATEYTNFVVGILIFTDTPRNEQMEHAARERHHVHIIWGLGTLEEDLRRIADEVGIKHPPRPRFAENEWSSVNELQYRGPAGQPDVGPGKQDAAPDRAKTPEADRQLTVGSATINIQHVDTLVIQHGPRERDTDG